MRSRRLLRALPLPAAALAAVLALPTTSPVAAPEVSVKTLSLAADITPGGPGAAPAGSKNVRLIGFNDVHGYLETGRAGKLFGVAAGGARQLTQRLTQLRAAVPTGQSAFVGAGDQIGASPLSSAVFNDEPTIDFLRDLKLDFSSVGNHEFDKGVDAVRRQQNGGCDGNPQSCVFSYDDSTNPDPALRTSQAVGSFAGLGRADASDTVSQPYATAADTTGYLAANVVDKVTRKPVFPAYGIKTFADGSKVAFIGEVLQSTPALVTPSGVASVDFLDEASTANALVPEIKAKGVGTIVLLVHQGGQQNGGTQTVDTCAGFMGPIAPIAQALDPSISVVVSGHTHQAYDCTVAGANGTKLVTSAAKYTQALTSVDLTLNPDGTLFKAHAENSLIDTAALTLEKKADGTPDSAVCPTAGSTLPSTGNADYDHARVIQCAASTQTATRAGQVVGAISGDISNGGGTNSARGAEFAAGDLVADAQLAAGRSNGAQIALMNPGGVRNSLLFSSNGGRVTYGDVFSVQPFGNTLQLINLTGADLYAVLRQQFLGCDAGTPGSSTQDGYDKILQPSTGFTFSIDRSQPCATKIVPGSVKLGGTPVDAGTTYKVVVNNFLQAGGDNFSAFKKDVVTGLGQDVDALVGYLTASSDAVNDPPQKRLDPPVTNRITVVPAPPTPVVPESSLAIGLPLAALVLIGGVGTVLVRRRRAGAEPSVVA